MHRLICSLLKLHLNKIDGRGIFFDVCCCPWLDVKIPDNEELFIFAVSNQGGLIVMSLALLLHSLPHNKGEHRMRPPTLWTSLPNVSSNQPRSYFLL